VTATAPRVLVGCLALLLGVLSSTTADAAGKRVGVPKFDGAQEALVRKKVMQILKAHGYSLAKSREMEIGLANTGALLDNDEGFAKVAKELALSAIVTGEIGKKRAKIAVHDGKDGALLGDATFAGANPRKIMAEVGRDFWRKLGDAVERGKTPSGAKKPTKVVAEAPEDDETTPDAAGEGEAAPEPEPRKKAAEPVAEGSPPAEGEEAPKKKKKKKKKTRLEGEGESVREEADEVVPPAFDFMLGFRGINRALAYNQDRSDPGLRPYNLPAGFAIYGRAIWFPIGAFTEGALKNLGIEATVEQAFGVSSSVPTGEKYGTSIHEFAGGLRYRMLFGSGSYFWGSGTGGEHAFLFTSTASGDREALDIPDVIYWYIRPGVGIHLALPMNLSFEVSGGFRWVVNGAGRQWSEQFFPFSTVNGGDAQVMLGWRFHPMLEARVGVDWRRYFSSMNCYDPAAMNGGNRCIRTLPTGEMVNFTAGGAVDQYWGFFGAVAILLGGTEVQSSDAEEPPPPPKRKRKASEEEEPSVNESGAGDE
jgi:hypothetical protein